VKKLPVKRKTPSSEKVESSAYLFMVVDPRGEKVYCEQQQWERHVVEAKPFMAKLLRQVQETIMLPNAIFRDADFEDRCCYYRLRPNGVNYMKVVTETVAEGINKMITAFPADSPKKGETAI
jgi:hypothetical protein